MATLLVPCLLSSLMQELPDPCSTAHEVPPTFSSPELCLALLLLPNLEMAKVSQECCRSMPKSKLLSPCSLPTLAAAVTFSTDLDSLFSAIFP